MSKYLIASFLIMFICFQAVFSQPLDIKDMNSMIPNDPNVIHGKFDNGLTYYIKANKKPENKAEIRIVVNAGSVDEDNDQQGLAHFLEHMCFNGTKNFPKNELVNFLESTGMRFGGDINASTGYDRTMYFLVLPTDQEGMLEKGFQVLEDWAHNVSFDQEELDKERGVIIEEWRSRRNAQVRAYLEHVKYQAYGSKYVDRFPIGDTAIILNAPREAFLRFYNDYYIPQNTAIIAVGDFDPKKVEVMIKKHFASIANPKNPRKLEEYKLKPHDETFVSIYKDKELTNASIEFVYKLGAASEGRFIDYKTGIVENLATQMMMSRLQELSRKSNAPFLQSFAYLTNNLGDDKSFQAVVVPKAEDIMMGYDGFLKEIFRLKQHGFNDSELERVKKEYLSNMESALKEKDKTENNAYCNEFTRHFTDGEAFPGIEYEMKLAETFLPQITVEQVSKVIQDAITDKGIVISLSAPDKADVAIPSKNDILAKYNEIKNSKLEPYDDKVIKDPLIAKLPTPGKIVSETKNDKLGTIRWKLSNGAEVILKPTDFQNDEIMLNAYSPGGTSLASDEDFFSAQQASSIMRQSGVGGFTLDQLQKMLAGKQVNVSARIEELREGINGTSTIKDLETFFQLLYLTFTKPTLDYEAFDAFMKNLKEDVTNSSLDPRSVFMDTISVTMANYHKRSMPLNLDNLSKIDPDKAYDFFLDRFADASDFKFFFAGNIEIDNFKPFVEQYIASLPALNRNEKWKDLGVKAPKGKVNKKVFKGIDPQSFLIMMLHDDFSFASQDRLLLSSMMEIFRIKLRESIREDKGGTYSPSSWVEMDKFPKSEYSFNIFFSLSPDRVDELSKAAEDVVIAMTKSKPEESYMVKMREIQKNSYKQNLKQNRYWLSQLSNYEWIGEDAEKMLEFEKRVDALTAADIQNAAKKYLDMKNVVEIVLFPENYKPQ